MEKSNVIMQMENFCMTRGGVLLDNVNLEIKEGDIVFFLGKNGCGKTTLLSLFRKEREIGKSSGGAEYAGNFKITVNGETHDLVTCDGSEKNYSNFYYRNIAYLDQSELSEWFASVERTLRLPTELALYELKKAGKITAEEYGKMTERLVKEVNGCIKILQDTLPEQEGRNSKKRKRKIKKTKNLSGGQKRLVSFFRTYVRAAVLGARVLVLDEPLNHLDCRFKKTIDDMLRSLIDTTKKAGNPITVLIVSHCLPFTFIKEDYCKQYKFTDLKNLEELKEKRRYESCLEMDL